MDVNKSMMQDNIGQTLYDLSMMAGRALDNAVFEYLEKQYGIAKDGAVYFLRSHGGQFHSKHISSRRREFYDGDKLILVCENWMNIEEAKAGTTIKRAWLGEK